MKTVVLNPEKSVHMSTWFDLVKEYTKRALTNRNDRLAAIHGLAMKHSGRFDGAYVVGLWTSELHAGLLWEVSNTVPAKSLERHLLLPSWSWASVEAEISFKTNYTDALEPVANMEVLEPTTLSLVLGRSISVPGLRCKSRYSRGALFSTTRRFTACNFCTARTVHVTDTVHCTMDSLEYLAGSTWRGEYVLCRGEFCCTLVAQQKGEHFCLYYFLILEQLQKSHQGDTGHDLFKRVGIGWQEMINGVEPGVLTDAEESDLLIV